MDEENTQPQDDNAAAPAPDAGGAPDLGAPADGGDAPADEGGAPAEGGDGSDENAGV